MTTVVLRYCVTCGVELPAEAGDYATHCEEHRGKYSNYCCVCCGKRMHESSKGYASIVCPDCKRGGHIVPTKSRMCEPEKNLRTVVAGQVQYGHEWVWR